MVYVFEDGRIVFDVACLTDQDEGKYVAVESLPPIEEKEGFVGYHTANLVAHKVEVEWVEADKSVPTPEPPKPQEPVYSPTEGELLLMKSQAAMYEEMQANRLSQLKANADIYEAILSNGGNV